MKDNIEHGIVKSWFENGVLKYEGEFREGRIVWSRSYDEEGKLVREKGTPR